MKFGTVSRERWKKLEPILDAALELPTSERSEYLDHACAGDAEMRAELNALLIACEHSDSLLSAPAALAYGPLLTGPKAKLPPLLGGRYHVVREIGRGGMATVYLADDPKHSRQVAVKVLHTDVARLIGRERFLREIEIAAGLSHPHILPLHDSGEANAELGRDYAVLYHVSPFVAGESLRDRLGREPALSVAEIVRLPKPRDRHGARLCASPRGDSSRREAGKHPVAGWSRGDRRLRHRTRDLAGERRGSLRGTRRDER